MCMANGKWMTGACFCDYYTVMPYTFREVPFICL